MAEDAGTAVGRDNPPVGSGTSRPWGATGRTRRRRADVGVGDSIGVAQGPWALRHGPDPPVPSRGAIAAGPGCPGRPSRRSARAAGPPRVGHAIRCYTDPGAE